MRAMFIRTTLAILTGVTTLVPKVQNTTIRSLQSRLVLSPMVLGLAAVFCIMGIR